MSDRKINLRCLCGNVMRADRESYDPPSAVEMVTNECDICNAASGGFGESFYFDTNGNEIAQEPPHD